MKAYICLLRYFTTWMQPLGVLFYVGAALLLGAIVLGLLNMKHEAFGLGIYAFVLLLALPYACAWYPFRTMLASRRLGAMPRFRLRLGLALLLFTLALASYLPLASMLWSPGAVAPRAGLAVFIAASLYTAAMQRAIASRYSVIAFSIGPFILIYCAAKLGPLMLIAFTRDASLLGLALASLLGWILALHALATRRAFPPPLKPASNIRDYAWDGRADLLGIVVGNYRGKVQSAAGTVLLGYPDGLAGRFFTMFNMLVLSPAYGLAALYFTGFAPAAAGKAALGSMFLSFSLVVSVFSSFSNGELAARARLLWLRQGGDRQAQWRRIERRLATDFVVVASIVVPITGVALMFDSLTLDPITYCLVALGGNVLGNYFSLAARLSQWSMFVQLLAAFAAGTGLTIGLVTAVLPLWLLVPLMLGLALLLRQQAWLRFAGVDWHRLRPASPVAKGKTL